jgi:uncharacterized protein (TIGR00730 family)
VVPAAADGARFARICVYCGSHTGIGSVYRDAAVRTGVAIAEAGLGLVTGGGRVGLMGVVADAALAAGGSVTGVIPRALAEREVAHAGLSELRIVDSMHERKALMAELSDGFVALPGGLGTLEEIAEMLTWAQLGLHSKPCALLNTDGYYTELVRFLDHAAAEGFVRGEHRDLLLVEPHPENVPERLRAWVPPALPRVISSREA